MKKIQSVLIANRGEPVHRGLSTLRKLGLRAIAVATAGDLKSPWVAASDAVVAIQSYNHRDELIAAALQSKADAIWPAWGFLSENSEFAAACEKNDIAWMGPSARVITLMGSKSDATAQAQKAGLKTIPEIVMSETEVVSENFARVEKECLAMGFPVLLKPAWGGGGQGQEVITDISQVKRAWESVCTINARQFRGGPILVQRYFTNARHIEAQVLGDKYGNTVILGERDCSIQRRNQKVIEEAPSPAMTPELREKFITDSLKLVTSIGYDSAGTIEYLFADGEFYFLEMNTRLQVEHPVTEETARVQGHKIDLVEQMLRMAAGEKLGFAQSDISWKGHAIEARIYAEDPYHDFRPAPGTVSFLKFPKTPNVRIESAMGFAEGVVDPAYDPMIAKMIVWGTDREESRKKLFTSLRETVILGVPTNLSFCGEILRNKKFISGDYTTRFIGQNPDLCVEKIESAGLALAAATCAQVIVDSESIRDNLYSESLTSLDHVSRLIPSLKKSYHVTLAGKSVEVTLEEVRGDHFRVGILDRVFELCVQRNSAKGFTVIFPDQRVCNLWREKNSNFTQIHFLENWYTFTFSSKSSLHETKDAHAAPMTGQIVKILVAPGDDIKVDQDLYQMESMKMVSTLRAMEAGVVEKILKNPGDPVKSGESVVCIKTLLDASALTDLNKVWRTEDLFQNSFSENFSSNIFEKIFSLFLGYDDIFVVEDDFFTNLKTQVVQGNICQKEFSRTIAKCLEHYGRLLVLFQEHSHALTFICERGAQAENALPQSSVEFLRPLLLAYGLKSLSDLDDNPRILLRIMKIHGETLQNFSRILESLLLIVHDTKAFCDELLEPVVNGINQRDLHSISLREKLLEILREMHPQRFAKIAKLPVAAEYYDEYRHWLDHPGAFLSDSEYNHWCENFKKGCQITEDPFTELPAVYADFLTRCFRDFDKCKISLPLYFVKQGIFLFELFPKISAEKNEERVPRYLVVADVKDTHFVPLASGDFSMPGFERAAIAAYSVLRLALGMTPRHEPNHVFLFANPEKVIPWKVHEEESASPGLTPGLARHVANRVSGFAADIRIKATEVVLPLYDLKSKTQDLMLIEVRHTKPQGLISRPPFALSDRVVESLDDLEAQMNQAQQMMGKLINRDRAKLLFDAGDFEELKFPDVDERTDVGLNVYVGKIAGEEALVYASDFRLRGGALGEREGKKLATSVILAYLTGKKLVGIHDGAGANIRESIASLGWAGVYFGAIANTGGFSNPEKFRAWFLGHCEKSYFVKVLNHFDVDFEKAMAAVKNQLLHFHLHLGATVGMLVYGASIAQLSLMNDQPESYRVLTGSAAVARVLGEKKTNYGLGGARVHAEYSGDIEMSFASEEEVIRQTRRLMKLFTETERFPQVQRNTALSAMDVPMMGGMILSRHAIAANVDDGEFFEIRSELKNAQSLMTGYAALAGHPVALAAMATDYGHSHERSFYKATRLIEAAHDLNLPLLLISGAHWEAPSEPVAASWILARSEFMTMLQKSRTPRLSFALGPRSIESSLHTQMDAIIYVTRGTETEFEKERIHKLATWNVTRLEEGFDQAARLLDYLKIPQKIFLEKEDACSRPVRFALPEQITEGYEMRDLMGDVFDANSFFEFWATDRLPLITGLARLGGQTVGVMADNPLLESGAQNIDSIQKFTRFHRFCERFQIPLIEFNDSPAFRPGSEMEQGGIQGVGGKSIREECLSSIPKVAVTLRQNYGGRFIHANLITLGPPRVGVILEQAKVGVMGAKGAVSVLFRKKLAALPESQRPAAEAQWEKEYEVQQLNPQNAVKLGYVEPPILLKDLRQKLCAIFQDGVVGK